MPLRYPNLRSPTLIDAARGRTNTPTRMPQQHRILPKRSANAPTFTAPFESMSMGQVMDPLLQNSFYGGMEAPSAQIGMVNQMGNSRAMEQPIDPLAQFYPPQLGTASAGGPPQLGTSQLGTPPYLPSWGNPGWLYGINQWGR